jgi:hypothetical protein
MNNMARNYRVSIYRLGLDEPAPYLIPVIMFFVATISIGLLTIGGTL